MGIIRLYICLMLKNLVCLLFLLSVTLGSFAQDNPILVEKSKKTKKIEGKVYYIHKVEKGQTLYSISKAYGTLISQIVFDNPDAMNGIKPGQELKIEKQDPSKAIVVEQVPLELDGSHIMHVVRPKETLYSLSKQYNTTLSEINKANKETLSDGLKIGDTLRIPVGKIEIEVEPPRLVQESLSILPLDTVEKTKGLKDTYNVVYLLPLFLSDTLEMVGEGELEESLKPKKTEKIKEEALNGIEFFQGTKLALDSLQKNGVRVNIYVFDTEGEGSESKIRQLFSKPEVKNADLIIGPFYQKLFATAQKYCEAYQIPIVSPVTRNSELLKNNPLSGKVTIPEKAEIQEMSRYISSRYCKNNVLVIHKGREDELRKAKWFKSAYKCDSLHQYSEINYKGATWDSLAHSLSRIDTNIVVVLSDDQAFVTSFFITLDKRKEDFPMTVFGTGSWFDFENIETDYYHDLRLHLPVENNIDFEDTLVVDFVKKYRDAYKNEPTFFSFQGFDLTYYFISAMNRMGVGYFDMLQFYRWQGFQSGFAFERNIAGEGLENQAVYIVKYQDFQLKKVN